MNTGKISESVLKRFVLGKIKTHREEVKKGAGAGEDCAFLAWKNPVTAVSTQTVTLPVSRAPYLAVMAAFNNLASQGVSPAAVTLSVTLPEGTEESVLGDLMEQAQECCGEWDARIAGGHTEVSAAVRWPVITATAMGEPSEGAWDRLQRDLPAEASAPDERAGKVGRKRNSDRSGSDHNGLDQSHVDQAGLDLVMSKWIGLEGTSILVRDKQEELSGRFSAGFLARTREQERFLSLAPEAAIALKSNVYAMHDMRNGGVFGALWELSQKLGVGLSIDLKKIPVRQETIEICEFYHLNPYMLLSGGALLMAGRDGFSLVGRLQEAGIPAAVIGVTTRGNDRLVRNGEESRYLGPPGPDEIYKVSFN